MQQIGIGINGIKNKSYADFKLTSELGNCQGSLERKERNIADELKEPVRKNDHWWQKIFK